MNPLLAHSYCFRGFIILVSRNELTKNDNNKPQDGKDSKSRFLYFFGRISLLIQVDENRGHHDSNAGHGQTVDHPPVVERKEDDGNQQDERRNK